MTGGHQQGETAGGAEPDHAEPAVASGLARQPRPRRIDLAEGLAPAGPQVMEHSQQARGRPPPEAQVDRQGQVPGAGQPVRLRAHRLIDAEPVVQYHHPRPASLTAGPRQVAGHPARGRGDRDIHRGLPSVLLVSAPFPTLPVPSPGAGWPAGPAAGPGSTPRSSPGRTARSRNGRRARTAAG